jgi:hypothetical protein
MRTNHNLNPQNVQTYCKDVSGLAIQAQAIARVARRSTRRKFLRVSKFLGMWLRRCD